MASSPEIAAEEYIRPEEPEAISAPEPKESKAPPLIIYYNPQYFQIVVVNSFARPAKKEKSRGVFRPSFDDRRFIHPSAFDGGSRQFIRPNP